jgi:hypothetical protein
MPQGNNLIWAVVGILLIIVLLIYLFTHVHSGA